MLRGRTPSTVRVAIGGSYNRLFISRCALVPLEATVADPYSRPTISVPKTFTDDASQADGTFSTSAGPSSERTDVSMSRVRWLLSPASTPPRSHRAGDHRAFPIVVIRRGCLHPLPAAGPSSPHSIRRDRHIRALRAHRTELVTMPSRKDHTLPVVAIRRGRLHLLPGADDAFTFKPTVPLEISHTRNPVLLAALDCTQPASMTPPLHPVFLEAFERTAPHRTGDDADARPSHVTLAKRRGLLHRLPAADNVFTTPAGHTSPHSIRFVGTSASEPRPREPRFGDHHTLPAVVAKRWPLLVCESTQGRLDRSAFYKRTTFRRLLPLPPRSIRRTDLSVGLACAAPFYPIVTIDTVYFRPLHSTSDTSRASRLSTVSR
ncbi:hypothetical protein B0H17DRAFT_1202253 [Mycena rosella]|uniref:Uncharacterized protein n=1 Tax=Mycena rosella TaxID=1033263 RepID=A0AAD7GIK3_MYCRO|nr:hypothetical protein B0H17DRAFT_1202253 [Mycena rosella]